ncbi:ScbA/BarX family gamma-butyrolactone biosynthesis protein [Streptomyces sp. XD-27]|uniref:ScbA/BarX family gamma-butyrolactone biosynthesis protein n=1 Tax=Streptomyces sp. XD-27 TaxID=3062779 RepID=UPI0026F437A0|nr:ScbA/BarX family gamma-butyrolactone biosynthesis protein [Streptomyces sp. XD-27]WKX71344.1 ScbA/BarX family gamma-butyrolactone biosynthesis protein [Streptomyces sp. XD-27]
MPTNTAQGHPVAAPVSVPVPRAYTHKSNPAEVLLTTWGQTGPDAYTVTARWPRVHDFYLTRYGMHDPLLLSETIRQTLPLLSHGAYEVPFGHQLLWRDFRWDLDPEALAADGEPAELTLHLTCPEVTYRRNRAASVALEVEAVRGGVRLGTARTRFAIQDRAVYERLRGRYADAAEAMARALPLPPPAPARPLGRDRFEDVVLSPTDGPHRWQLRTDTAHPVLFDHAVDHAPGMLLIEAARQAAQAVADPRPTIAAGMDIVFTRYAEMDAPCWILAEPLAAAADGRARVRVTARQDDTDIFSAAVTLAPAAER